MSDATLPARPHPEQLRRQAKRLLEDARSGDASARGRIVAYFETPPTALRLHHAQLTVAREYGYPSWRALVAHVEELREAAQRIVEATTSGDLDAMRGVLDRHPGLVRTVVDRGRGEFPADAAAMSLLHLCAAEGQTAAAELLIRRGVEVDRRNRSGRAALHDALEYGARGITALLLESGAEVDAASAALLGDVARLEALVERDPRALEDRSTGMAVLGWASYGGHPEVLDLLHRHGVPLDAHDALFPAAACGHHRFLRRAVDLGVDVRSVCGKARRTALHEAAWGAFSSDRLPAVEVLLEAGADVGARDADGKTPRELARAKLWGQGGADANVEAVIARLG